LKVRIKGNVKLEFVNKLGYHLTLRRQEFEALS